MGVCLSACIHDNLKTVACMTINVKEDHHELIGIPYFLVDEYQVYLNPANVL